MYKAEKLRREYGALGSKLENDIKTRQYHSALAILEKLKRLRHSDRHYDFAYFDAIKQAGSPGEHAVAIEHALLRFESAKPGNVWPHVLLGLYYHDRAENARGCGWADSISAAAWSAMRNFDRRAQSEFKHALSINPRILAIYDGMMNIENNESSLASINSLYMQSRRYFPGDYILAADYMEALEPRWHGNYHLMNEFAYLMRGKLEENPRFYTLTGMVYADKADMAYENKNYGMAIAFYDVALQYGDYPSWMDSAGNAASHIFEYRVAYAYYARYLLYHPEDTDTRKYANKLKLYCENHANDCSPKGKSRMPWKGETLSELQSSD